MVGKLLLGKPGFESLELNDDFVDVKEVYPHLLSDAGKNNICLIHKDNSDFNLRISFSKSSLNNKLTILSILPLLSTKKPDNFTLTFFLLTLK